MPHHLRKKIISKDKKYVKGIKDVIREHGDKEEKEDNGNQSEDSEGRVRRPKKVEEDPEEPHGEKVGEVEKPVESAN